MPHEPSTVGVKAAVLLGSTDLQGKAYLLYMTQHNGEGGCLTCEESGFVAAQGKGHTRCYPYRPPAERAPNRTMTTFLENAVKANQSKKKVVKFGILYGLLSINKCVGSLTHKMQDTGPAVYSPYPRRLEHQI